METWYIKYGVYSTVIEIQLSDPTVLLQFTIFKYWILEYHSPRKTAHYKFCTDLLIFVDHGSWLIILYRYIFIVYDIDLPHYLCILRSVHNSENVEHSISSGHSYLNKSWFCFCNLNK